MRTNVFWIELAEEALYQLKKARGRTVPETPEQMAWIRRFPEVVRLYEEMSEG